MAAGDDHERSGLLRRARATTTARTRFVVRLSKSRQGSILAVVVLSALAAIALFYARETDQYVGNLLLNIGASFVGAVVTYALINPLMTRAENREENTVRIFDTGVELLNDQHRKSFLAACRAALKGGVQVQILPHSEQRSWAPRWTSGR